jgi:hypothetical protein
MLGRVLDGPAPRQNAPSMLRSFNTAGPCDPSRDYMLPAMARLPEVRGLIDRSKYFVVHAPRQVGKTTALLALARELTQEGRYTAALVSMESGAPFGDDVGTAELAVLDAWRAASERRLPPELLPPPWPDAPPGRRISRALQAWAKAAPRPLVLFLDEIDALRDKALLSILRQLRDGYPDRPSSFPAALALIGLRDVRDYKIASGDRDHVGTASPFNIKARSLTLRNFTREEIAELYAQHTAETGQTFLPEAVDLAFTLTQGQPWLVNAIAAVAVDELAVANPIYREVIVRVLASGARDSLPQITPTWPNRGLANVYASPDGADGRVVAYPRVLRDNGGRIEDGGRNDQPIGGIAVEAVSEPGSLDAHGRRERQELDLVRDDGLLDPFERVSGQADSLLFDEHGHLEATDGRERFAPRVTKRLRGGLAERRRIADPPDPGVCIEENHASAFHASSTGSTMSPLIVTLPRSDAMASSSTMGTTFATGFPRLVTTIGSPERATRSSSARHSALNFAAGITLRAFMVMKI